MNTDIRLSVNFFNHIKTLQLERRCGKEGVLCLLKLWVWAAVNRPSGDLSGYSLDDLELFSGWTGKSGCFGEVLRDVGWLDGEGEGNSFQLHGWEEFQTWVTDTARRENSARMSALARKNSAAYQRLKAQGVKGITKEEYAEYVHWSSGLVRGNAPAPFPSPFPFPAPKRTRIEQAKNPKTENPKTDFERKWDGEYAQRVNPLDYIRKIQEIAKNAPKIPERILGVSGGQCPPELQSDTGLESEVNTNGKDNKEDDERRRAVG